MQPVRDTNTIHVESFIQNTICTVFGIPKRLVCDRGTAFTSKRFIQFCQKYDIKLVYNAIATPRANGQVERYNRSTIATLAASSNSENLWDNKIEDIAWGLNTSINKTTGESPFQCSLAT